jgi:hypothetical protein
MYTLNKELEAGEERLNQDLKDAKARANVSLLVRHAITAAVQLYAASRGVSAQLRNPQEFESKERLQDIKEDIDNERKLLRTRIGNAKTLIRESYTQMSSKERVAERGKVGKDKKKTDDQKAIDKRREVGIKTVLKKYNEEIGVDKEKLEQEMAQYNRAVNTERKLLEKSFEESRDKEEFLASIMNREPTSSLMKLKDQYRRSKSVKERSQLRKEIQAEEAKIEQNEELAERILDHEDEAYRASTIRGWLKTDVERQHKMPDSLLPHAKKQKLEQMALFIQQYKNSSDPKKQQEVKIYEHIIDNMIESMATVK